jgi:tetratricopeptide (TPR) repeat protein
MTTAGLAFIRGVAMGVLSMLATVVPAQDRVQVERRAQSVGTLIESSSAARQIEGSGVLAARERRDNARLIHREAVIALQSGDLVNAAKLLDQSAKEMMVGVRFAKPEQVAGEKNKLDFAARLESTRALLAAQQRITREKSAGAEAQEATRTIERQLGDAQSLAAQSRYEEARPVLDRAYLTARVSIESMRRGDTLVRSLNFASPREEYDYEVDRNETHRMLITDIQAFTEKAAVLRRDAQARAAQGDHAGAIKLLEDSTRELIRAIRVGGIYIPG